MDKSLSLCDPHNSIIHQFGCEGSCTRPAGICLKGCTHYYHQQKVGKHQFINAKQFYSIVGCLRQKYLDFKMNFNEVYVKRFFQQVKASISSFEQYMEKQFLEKNPLVDLFCKYTSSGGEMFQQVVEDDLDQIQFSELKCREVFHLRKFDQLLQKQGKQQQQKRVMRLLSKVFQYHLRTQKILLPLRSTFERVHKPQEMIEVDRLDSLVESLQKKINNIQFSQKQEKIDELLLIVRCEPKELQKNIDDITCVTKVFANLQSYLQKSLPEKLALAVNFPLVKNCFWDSFISFIGNKGLKQVKVCTTVQMNPSKAFQSEINSKYGSIFTVEIKHNTKWQQISALIFEKAQN